MEISIDESDEKHNRLHWSSMERLDLLKNMCESDIRIMTMCLSGHRKYPIGSENEDIRNQGMAIMSRDIDLAADIGIRIVQIAGYDEYHIPSTRHTRSLFSENLKRSVEMASKKGVTLAFETMETEFLNTIEKAMVHVREVNSPYLQVYPDLGNITNAAVMYNRKVCDDINTGLWHIAAMNLKETVPGKFREIPYGTGHVDFRSAVRTVSAKQKQA
jgi:L-ribulose-5-phosphate 3-epimerase